MGKYRRRYELAEEILARGGTDEEIQRRIMQEFPDSRENPTRPQWYRRSWNKHGHCRGDGNLKDIEPRSVELDRLEAEPSSTVTCMPIVPVRQESHLGIVGSRRLVTLENEWLSYAWSVLTDGEHVRQCEKSGGTGIEDVSLRWPGYLGERYKPGGLMIVANIHRDFASGRAGADLASRLVLSTKAWRDIGRSEASDSAYLSANRTCYLEGLRSWTVGSWLAKFVHLAGLRFEDVTYLNAARCQSMVGARQSLQRLCLRRFPLRHLETILRPSLVLTCSTVVRDETRLDAPVRWFHQRNGIDRYGRPFDEWATLALAELA
jgi:hypothetical protein